jgi:hypothetical protein
MDKIFSSIKPNSYSIKATTSQFPFTSSSAAALSACLAFPVRFSAYAGASPQSSLSLNKAGSLLPLPLNPHELSHSMALGSRYSARTVLPDLWGIFLLFPLMNWAESRLIENYS